MKNKFVWLLSLGHMITDINQGALPALLPFFIAEYDLSYTAAASIVFAANVASSIIQPLFGYAADKLSKPWLLPMGMITAGLGLGMTGLCESYQWILVLAVVSGIGVAAYHPEAARLVNFAAGNKKNTAMSIFGVGGNIGFAIGPVFITTALLYWGLKGTVVLLVPVLIMAVFMTTQFSSFRALTATKSIQKNKAGVEPERDNWWAFIRLTIVIVGRSIIFLGLNTFIPIYWVGYLHQSKVVGSLALSFFAISGIIGNLAGGKLADRLGQKRVILMGFLGLTLFLPLFIFINNAHVALLSMIPIGFFLYAAYSPSIVLGQSYLPNRIGLSSGITLGVAFSIGGAATPIIGKIADVYGIWFAMVSIACLPIIFFVAAMSLSDPQKNSAKAPSKATKELLHA
ncbi:MAG: MFS transporter [Desulfoplanes sp.]|nr:MFS transporter [Desulfoplanes sp.]